MPNIKSAEKRVRSSEKSRGRNRTVKNEVKQARRALGEALTKKDKAAAQTAYAKYCSVLDKAAKRNVIPRNTAIRRKGRTAEMVKAI